MLKDLVSLRVERGNSTHWSRREHETAGAVSKWLKNLTNRAMSLFLFKHRINSHRAEPSVQACFDFCFPSCLSLVCVSCRFMLDMRSFLSFTWSDSYTLWFSNVEPSVMSSLERKLLFIFDLSSLTALSLVSTQNIFYVSWASEMFFSSKYLHDHALETCWIESIDFIRETTAWSCQKNIFICQTFFFFFILSAACLRLTNSV